MGPKRKQFTKFLTDLFTDYEYDSLENNKTNIVYPMNIKHYSSQGNVKAFDPNIFLKFIPKKQTLKNYIRGTVSKVTF